MWAYVALKLPFSIIFLKLGQDFFLIFLVAILISSFFSVIITYVIVLLKRGEITFDRLCILFVAQVTFHLVFPIVCPLLLYISSYYPEFINNVISYILSRIGGFIRGFIPIIYMDDGNGRSPSPFQGREVIIVDVTNTNSILRKLGEVKDMHKSIRPRGNLLSLFSSDEANVFLQVTSGIRVNDKPMFVSMRNMSPADLQAAYTGETADPNSIFIFYRGNYRPCHSDNTNYINKAIFAMHGRR